MKMHAVGRYAATCSRRRIIPTATARCSSSSTFLAAVSLEDTCGFLASRNYSASVESSSKSLKKEERRKLVMEVVEKHKALNNGQLPRISLVRKEVGGGYNILKEIMQDIEQEHNSSILSTVGKQAGLEDTLGPPPAHKGDGTKKVGSKDSSPSPIKTKKVVHSKKVGPEADEWKDMGSAVPKELDGEMEKNQSIKQDTLKSVSPELKVNPVELLEAHIEKGKRHKSNLVAVKHTSQDVLQKVQLATPLTVDGSEETHSEDETSVQTTRAKKKVVLKEAVDEMEETNPGNIESEESRVSAEETVEETEHLHESPLNAGIKKDVTVDEGPEQLKGLSMKGGTTGNQPYPRPFNPFGVRVNDIPSNVSMDEVKEVMTRYGDIQNISSSWSKNHLTYIVWFKSDVAARNAVFDRHVKVHEKWYSISRQFIPWTPVVRISNLPDNISEHKLLSTCKMLCTVSGLEMRKGGIADVHFCVKDPLKLNSIVERLIDTGLGDIKVVQAPRFSCGNESLQNGLQPRPAHVKQVRDKVLNQLEQQIKELSGHLHECRQLVVSKQEARAGMF